MNAEEIFQQFVHTPKKTKSKKKLAKQVDQATEQEHQYAINIGSGGAFVYAASGPAPIKLQQYTQDAVDEYCEACICQGRQDNKIITIQAIKHWLMHQLAYDSKEFKIVTKMVDNWYNRKMTRQI